MDFKPSIYTDTDRVLEIDNTVYKSTAAVARELCVDLKDLDYWSVSNKIVRVVPKGRRPYAKLEKNNLAIVISHKNKKSVMWTEDGVDFIKKHFQHS